MTKPTENQQQTARNSKGQFKKGSVGNPKGRIKGSRNKATTTALSLLEGQAEQVSQAVIESALQGNMIAARLVLERLVPPCKEQPLPELTLPKVDNAQDLPKITAAILQAVTSGELLPSQAQALANLVQTHSKALELTELEARITKLENNNK